MIQTETLFLLWLGGTLLVGVLCGLRREAENAAFFMAMWPFVAAVVVALSPFLLAFFIGDQISRIGKVK